MLWDIDGTLVDTHGHGKRAFVLALERTWGISDDLADIRFGGATDLGVLAQLRRRLALDPARDARFFTVLESTLVEVLAETPARALKNARETVRALAARGAAQALVTGNARACAFVKLRAAGIDVDPLAHGGGFGDEHADRDELARRALARARERVVASGAGDGGAAFTRVVLVGDTPSDVGAARAIGAVSVAVATGGFSRAELAAAGADVVVDALDVAQVLA